MLRLRYGLFTAGDIELFIDQISSFCEHYTSYQCAAERQGEEVYVRLQGFTCGYDALQLIHTFDTITINNDITCCLMSFLYLEERQC